jgi:hypothetical protein
MRHAAAIATILLFIIGWSFNTTTAAAAAAAAVTTTTIIIVREHPQPQPRDQVNVHEE